MPALNVRIMPGDFHYADASLFFTQVTIAATVLHDARDPLHFSFRSGFG